MQGMPYNLSDDSMLTQTQRNHRVGNGFNGYQFIPYLVSSRTHVQRNWGVEPRRITHACKLKLIGCWVASCSCLVYYNVVGAGWRQCCCAIFKWTAWLLNRDM